MTKIALISDLHNESLRESQRKIPDIRLTENVDVLVLAGDIDVQEHGVLYAIRQSERLHIPVIYVLGNHELYRSDDKPLFASVKKATQRSSVHVLDTESVVIKNTLFIGATLWTDFELLGSEHRRRAINHAAFNMHDYYNIQIANDPFSPVFTPNSSQDLHEIEKKFIEKELANEFNGKKVVVTHHAPSIQCLPSFEHKDLLSACYASHLDWMIQKYQPHAWLYGHVHYPRKLQLGKTIVASQPHGYPHIVGTPEFFEPLIIEL